MGDSLSNANGQSAGNGDALLRVDIAVTVALCALSALTFLLAERLDLIYAALSAVLFFLGAGLMALGLWNGIQRSRVDEVTLVGLAAVSKTHVASRARNILWAMIVLQVAVTVLFASLRPFTQQAFGILAPTFGLGVAVLWGSRFGSFHPRNDS